MVLLHVVYRTLQSQIVFGRFSRNSFMALWYSCNICNGKSATAAAADMLLVEQWPKWWYKSQWVRIISKPLWHWMYRAQIKAPSSNKARDPFNRHRMRRGWMETFNNQRHEILSEEGRWGGEANNVESGIALIKAAPWFRLFSSTGSGPT